MGAKSDWLKEERRRTLGDWVLICPSCGHVQRYFEGSEDELPTACPTCSSNLVGRCPACDARIASAFAVDCEECGASLREANAFGSAIRKPGRPA